MLPVLISPLEKQKYPVWDSKLKKMVNHYKTSEVHNTIFQLEKLHNALATSENYKEYRLPERLVARLVTKSRQPPSEVATWVKRMIRIMYCPELKEAVLNGTVNSRYALCDLANRVGDNRFKQYIEAACRGELTNAQFRKISKQLNK